MSLNPDSACMERPSAKLSFNINAFNGNTTNFRPCPKSFPQSFTPVQPHGEAPVYLNIPQKTIRPMPM